MGQLQSMMYETRVKFDENSDNGLVLTDRYLPEELLSEILFHVDHKTLLNCQLVCKRWQLILQNYVWRKKAEAVIGQHLDINEETSWLLYYNICSKKFLEKNLIKNHSGKNGPRKHWKVITENGDNWGVECPPIGAPPLPISEPIFEGKQHCFVTSYYNCSKQQTIDLIAEGVPPQLLEIFQPPIVVSEWYCSREDCPAAYEFSATLIDDSGNIMDTTEFRDTLENERQNTWFYIEHEFTNYGPGLRKVIFQHAGIDRRFWSGHYGSKMAGACVKVNLPKHKSMKIRETGDSQNG
ncbi:F-box only protein 44 isoform X1 [Neodiprion lecontei]|uniref:F-box only protein 44 isoform X1 n=1 Tax=Neodiprion lecontei TaxID=441921 RepID=A0A6J0C352_NEOLC|nr:F-box only protein 44 isoform X1 [Neodiprion lecontei]XP_046601664.1 F-box only protein 44 isoform X1 [Neodiprion lecontei]